MQRRRKAKVNAKGRNTDIERYVKLPHRILRSEAYRSLSTTSRALLVDLAMIENGKNNGSLYLSVRDAADRLGMSDPCSVSTAFYELIDRGIIRCSKEAHFAVKAADYSRARCWKLTWLPADGKPGTFEWEAYRAPPKTKANTRAQRGLAAMKRFIRDLTSHRLPVMETIATSRFFLPEEPKR